MDSGPADAVELFVVERFAVDRAHEHGPSENGDVRIARGGQIAAGQFHHDRPDVQAGEEVVTGELKPVVEPVEVEEKRIVEHTGLDRHVPEHLLAAGQSGADQDARGGRHAGRRSGEPRHGVALLPAAAEAGAVRQIGHSVAVIVDRKVVGDAVGGGAEIGRADCPGARIDGQDQDRVVRINRRLERVQIVDVQLPAAHHQRGLQVIGGLDIDGGRQQHR